MSTTNTMRKITVTNYKEAVSVGSDNPRLDTLEIEGPEEMDASDGYHTFTELYDHRIELYIALCRVIEKDTMATHGYVWRSKTHSDGSSFEGWFVLGIGKDKGYQITYHLPISRWDDTSFAQTLEKSPEWDGHTSGDVLSRLKSII